MKKFSVTVGGQEPVIIDADKMQIDEHRLLFVNNDGSLVATFSYGHVVDAHEVQTV